MIQIGKDKIGPNYPPYFIAEIGSNHDGNLERMLHLVDIAAECGADAIKTQHFTAKTIVSRRGFAVLGKMAHQAAWSQDVYETYRAAETSIEWTPIIAERCHSLGLAYLTTPYALEIVDAVVPYVDAFKIGSGDINWHQLIDCINDKGKPILMATGASTCQEVLEAARRVTQPLVLMQCSTDYSGNDAEIRRYANLRVLEVFKAFCDTVGISDHTSGSRLACTAVALGASVVEKHFTDDRLRPGPDHAFAMEPHDFALMGQDVRNIWRMLGVGIKRVEENEREARIVQRRALRWARQLSSDHLVQPSDIVATRPCPEGALEPYYQEEIVGRTLKHTVEADVLVQTEDLI
jgi:N-acetylneuraminate synthase